MLFSLSPDSKLHTRVNEKRDRERHGVVWGETIFCRTPPKKKMSVLRGPGLTFPNVKNDADKHKSTKNQCFFEGAGGWRHFRTQESSSARPGRFWRWSRLLCCAVVFSHEDRHAPLGCCCCVASTSPLSPTSCFCPSCNLRASRSPGEDVVMLLKLLQLASAGKQVPVVGTNGTWISEPPSTTVAV